MRITSQLIGKSTYLAYKWGQNNNSSNLNSVNSLWGNFSQTNASSGNMFDLAAQFGSLKASNALIKAQYGKKNSSVSNSISSITNKTNSATDTAAAEKLADSADALKDAAVKLSQNGKKSLFKADAEGNYDMEAIASAVTEFVDSYNTTKKDVVEAGNNKALQTAVSMVTRTASMEKMLNKVGITINNDNTLSVNTETLKGAEMSDIKSLFSGTSSYAYGVGRQAAQIAGYAEVDAKMGAALSRYSSSRGSIIDMYA